MSSLSSCLTLKVKVIKKIVSGTFQERKQIKVHRWQETLILRENCLSQNVSDKKRGSRNKTLPDFKFLLPPMSWLYFLKRKFCKRGNFRNLSFLYNFSYFFVLFLYNFIYFLFKNYSNRNEWILNKFVCERSKNKLTQKCRQFSSRFYDKREEFRWMENTTDTPWKKFDRKQGCEFLKRGCYLNKRRTRLSRDFSSSSFLEVAQDHFLFLSSLLHSLELDRSIENSQWEFLSGRFFHRQLLNIFIQVSCSPAFDVFFFEWIIIHTRKPGSSKIESKNLFFGWIASEGVMRVKVLPKTHIFKSESSCKENKSENFNPSLPVRRYCYSGATEEEKV